MEGTLGTFISDKGFEATQARCPNTEWEVGNYEYFVNQEEAIYQSREEILRRISAWIQHTKTMCPLVEHVSVLKKLRLGSSCQDRHWVNVVSLRMRRSGNDLQNVEPFLISPMLRTPSMSKETGRQVES